MQHNQNTKEQATLNITTLMLIFLPLSWVM